MTLLVALLAFSLVGDVRQAINRGDLTAAEQLVEAHRASTGVTPEMLEAHSWLARGALFAKQYDKAESFAAKTKQLVLEELKKRPLDAERHLPIALGAAIEVQSHVLAASGDRAGALEYLRQELETYRDTSIRTRIQKNINLFGLEGKKAPALEGAALSKGKPALLFFWAHWCGDCKSMAPTLARIRTEFPDLAVIAPTQLYGYAEQGRDAEPAEERTYIERMRTEFYQSLSDVPAPISEENFKVYGASTTPTLALVDRNGIVRMYNPGRMSYEDLTARIRKIY